MNIQLDNAGKRFNRDWIFRKLNYDFKKGNKCAITGPNGSGKSTLLQTVAGSIGVSEGAIRWNLNNDYVAAENVYRQIAIAAPYLEVIEEMTATEFLNFHSVFKPLVLPVKDILQIIGLEHAVGKQIRNYSSGMKQRIKLAQAIFSDTAVLLLDEPCTNLDSAGYELYYHLIDNYCQSKLVIVGSNDEKEFIFCKEHINILDYK